MCRSIQKENYTSSCILTYFFPGNISAGEVALQSDQVLEYVDDPGHGTTYYVNADSCASTTTDDRDVDNSSQDKEEVEDS